MGNGRPDPYMYVRINKLTVKEVLDAGARYLGYHLQ
jgi:hypothetical protein